MVIRRFGVWSVARLYGGMMAIAGLLAGLMFAGVAMIGGAAGLAGMDAKAGGGGLAVGGLGALFGVGAIILMPICYGIIGIVTGAIGAALYNLFAGLFGGIEVDVEQ